MKETPTKSAAKKTAATKSAAPAPAAAKKVAAKKAPAKKSASKSTPASVSAAASAKPAPTHEQISRRAHEIWKQRGHGHGNHHNDWAQAEHELKNS